MLYSSCPCRISFHPLKAGRRLSNSPCSRRVSRRFPSPQGGSETAVHYHVIVFIPRFPSPQGGSETRQVLEAKGINAEFPSPQGGSETRRALWQVLNFVVFPSPQGGSETTFGVCRLRVDGAVSIPSRRVGD